MAGVTLYGIPFAGGNSYSYRPLAKLMPEQVDFVALDPPGRGKRQHEQPVHSLAEMTREIIAAIRDSLRKPYAFFGHSMGGLIAYLATRMLAEENLPLPQHLFISGKAPPHIRSKEALWHQLPLPAFIEKLRELGGCPEAVLKDQELMEYFAPIIRNDMRAVAEYHHEPAFPLDVPITVMIGTAESTTAEQASQWRAVTTSACRLVQYEGGHFFLFDHPEAICSLVGSTLHAA